MLLWVHGSFLKTFSALIVTDLEDFAGLLQACFLFEYVCPIFQAAVGFIHSSSQSPLHSVKVNSSLWPDFSNYSMIEVDFVAGYWNESKSMAACTTPDCCPLIIRAASKDEVIISHICMKSCSPASGRLIWLTPSWDITAPPCHLGHYVNNEVKYSPINTICPQLSRLITFSSRFSISTLS